MSSILHLLPLFLLVGPMGSSVQAQHAPHPPDTLRAADYVAGTHVPAPPLAVGPNKAASATILVEFEGGFPPEARSAFEFAAGIWESFVDSPVPIRIRAQWAELDESVLGAASATCFFRDDPAFPLEGTFYPVALAEALIGRDLNPSGSGSCGDGADIVATFNSTFDFDGDGVLDWYFGTDGNSPRGDYDFGTVVLHEIGHGLGFVGSFDVVTDEGDFCPQDGIVPLGQGCWGLGDPIRPIVFDRYAEDGQDVPLLDTAVYPNPSEILGDVLQSDALFFDGPGVQRVTDEFPIDLFAPSNFEPGSSFSHLNEVQCVQRGPDGECVRACLVTDAGCFPSSLANPSLAPGGVNSLMTPRLARAESIFSPGPFTCAIFSAIGWPMGAGCEALLVPIATLAATASGADVRVAFDLAPGRPVAEVVLEQETADGTFAPVADVPPFLVDPDEAEGYEVLLQDLREGSYTFRLRVVRIDGRVTFSEPVTANIVRDAVAVAAYPSPFTDLLRVEVVAGEAQPARPVRVALYDVLGRRVAVLASDIVGGDRGNLALIYRPSDLPSGLYFVRVEGEDFVRVREVVHVAP